MLFESESRGGTMTTRADSNPRSGLKASDALKISGLLYKKWLPLIVAGLAATALFALWIGFQDVAWEVSLAAQILGFFFIVAGGAALVGAATLTVKLLPSRRWRKTTGDQLARIAAGAIAGIYVDMTIVVYSFRYQLIIAGVFGALMLNCVFLAFKTLPPAWGIISKGTKGLGITLALLGSAANFWFVSFYLPANTQVGVEYGLSVGPVVRSGGDRLVTLDLTMDNESSVTALTVGSMVVVRGISYAGTGNSNVTAQQLKKLNGRAQQQMSVYAGSLARQQSAGGSAAIQNPNIQFDDGQSGVVLKILRPIDDNSYLFSNDTFSHYFDVVIPESNIVALDVEIYVQYARVTRLTLSGNYPPAIKSSRSCPDDERSAWNVNQSALVRFTHGNQVLYSYWCADPANPSINSDIVGADSPKAEGDIASTISVTTSTRDEEFVLH